MRTKTTNGNLITRCPAFILLERSIWGCCLAPKGTIRRYEVLKWLEILSQQQSFLPPVDDKRNKNNKTSTVTKAHNRSYYISMNVDEYLSGFFVKICCIAKRFQRIFHVRDYVVDVFFAFVTILVLLFLFLLSSTGGKKLCCWLKISSHFKTSNRRIVPLGAKQHPQMDLSSSINAGQRVMRFPICCFCSKTV